MAVISVREESRSGSQPIGGSPQLTRVFSVTLSAPLSAAQIAAACGVTLGTPHPDFPRAVVIDVSVDESRIEEAPPESIEEENEEIKRELQENTPLPLPPDEILQTELPVLRQAEGSSE
jgi:hypothetical protein